MNSRFSQVPMPASASPAAPGVLLLGLEPGQQPEAQVGRAIEQQPSM
jgi:hypothetical protein